ncbi:MAG TPA: HDOD domain-containing protein [Anaerovoracaceae bacterium]|nr:HDOD domain-containing protein [Anaerovoracaceae bacterium]
MKRILVVDDDIHIRSSMSEAFDGTDYGIITVENGPSALRILKTEKVDLVVSSMKLPLMDGYDLLSNIKEKYPNVIRVIMCSYDEEASVLKTILKNIAKFHILKPWSNEKLLEYIGQIFETEDILKSNDLLLLINNLEKLPTIETSYQKILKMIEKDADTGSISLEIEKDFAISTKLLQIANSAFYGLQTGSVKHATVYLGLQNLKSLIYSTSILNSFNSVSHQDQQRLNDLWNHALLTSKLLHYTYEVFMKKKLPEAACSAGLLHNIGALVMMHNRIENYTEMINKARTKSLNLLEMEQEAFHVTHQEAGGYLVSWWKLPFPIVEAALYHHRPFDSCVLNKEIVAAVHLAQHYAWKLTKQPVVTEFYPQVFDVLGIPINSFEAAVNWNSWV